MITTNCERTKEYTEFTTTSIHLKYKKSFMMRVTGYLIGIVHFLIHAPYSILLRIFQFYFKIFTSFWWMPTLFRLYINLIWRVQERVRESCFTGLLTTISIAIDSVSIKLKYTEQWYNYHLVNNNQALTWQLLLDAVTHLPINAM